MKTILRTVAILAAAVLVTYGAIALLGSGGSAGTRGGPEGGRGFAQGTLPDGAQAGFRGGGPRGGGEGFGGGDRGDRDGGGGLFGLSTVIKNLFIVSLIILVVTLIGKGWKALRRRLNARPPTLATPGV